MEGQNSVVMIKLTSTIFLVWKQKMLDMLICRDLIRHVQGKTKSEKMSDEDWKTLKLKATATIRQWFDDNIFHHIVEESDAQTLWKKLESMFQKGLSRNKAMIIRRLVNLKYQDSVNMT